MKFDRDLCYSSTHSELDLELAMIMSMSAQEAAIYAAQAFAEVEALVEEAEAATEEIEAVEAYADATEAFVKLQGKD